MTINEAGLALIKQFEGCKLVAYQDIVGVWTIGYGCTGGDIIPGMVIDQEEADRRLLEKLKDFEFGVEHAATMPLNDNQFSALVCFAYNLGIHSLERSNLLKKINNGDYEGAADEFLKWDMAGGKVVPGLARRRAAERALFLS